MSLLFLSAKVSGICTNMQKQRKPLRTRLNFGLKFKIPLCTTTNKHLLFLLFYIFSSSLFFFLYLSSSCSSFPSLSLSFFTSSFSFFLVSPLKPVFSVRSHTRSKSWIFESCCCCKERLFPKMEEKQKKIFSLFEKKKNWSGNWIEEMISGETVSSQFPVSNNVSQTLRWCELNF